MKDKNREQIMPSGPYDIRQYVEFVHVIGVAMQNNCSTAKWRSLKYVPENVKKAMMDQLLCNYTLEDTNKELMKLMEETLKGASKGGVLTWSGMEDQ
ncbi:hypothetical protein C1H46_036320 [Malus baccata]|uniref:Uncharacterized protein n=1 Tax=Malus baccata TaxID=106549 RepID=A0A540KV90_MALBA|nr:hypothetical protein C1H46_036320 [Malus baccata]